LETLGKVLYQIFAQALDTQGPEFIRKTKIEISKDLHTFTELIEKRKVVYNNSWKGIQGIPRILLHGRSVRSSKVQNKNAAAV
jgi:hypothetical protein